MPKGIIIMGIIGKNGYWEPLQPREEQRHHLKGTMRAHLAWNHINNLIPGREVDAETVKVNYVTTLCPMTIFFCDIVSFFLQSWPGYHCCKCIKSEIACFFWLILEIPTHGRLRQKDQGDFSFSLGNIVNSKPSWDKK